MALEKKITIATLQRRKADGEKFAMLTSYDATTAAWQQAAGVECLLVGDSLGGTILGEPDTTTVTMDLSVALTAAVRRGAPLCYLVADMPFLSYRTVDLAIENAGRYVREARVDCIKLETDRRGVELIAAMSSVGLAVMPHLGLLPQRKAQMGGYKVQGATASAAMELIETARLMADAGAVALLLEATPPAPAAIIAEQLDIPVIGCGAGAGCDGFVVVTHDMLGLLPGRTPKFVRRYADLGPAMQTAFEQYARDVQAKQYPAPEHDYPMDADELVRLRELVDREG